MGVEGLENKTAPKNRMDHHNDWDVIHPGMKILSQKSIRFYFYIFIFYKTLTGPNQDATQIKRHKKPGSLEEYHFA